MFAEITFEHRNPPTTECDPEPFLYEVNVLNNGFFRMPMLRCAHCNVEPAIVKIEIHEANRGVKILQP